MIARLAAVLLAALALAATRAAAGPALDGDEWARRNVAVLREAVEQIEAEDSPANLLFAFGMSIGHNPLLLRDPFAGDVLEAAESFLAKRPDEAEALRPMLAFLRRPEAERVRLSADEVEAALDDDEPDGRPEGVYKLTSRLKKAIAAGAAARADELMGRVEAAAREREDWDGLALAHLRLGHFALGRGDRQAAAKHADAVLDVLGDHPDFQDPKRGNTNGPSPGSLTSLMLALDRQADLERFAAGQTPAVQSALAVSLVGRLAGRGDFDAAEAVARRLVAPVDAASAALIADAMRGEAEPAEDDPLFGGIQARIAYGHAARGDVETAGRMLIAMQEPDGYHPAGFGRLADHHWARLAMVAADSGREEAARRGFGRAIEAVDHDSLRDEEERRELQRLVGEAVEIGAFEVARDMLSTSGSPGAWARLGIARAYRARGDVDEARAMLREALDAARGRRRGTGSAMAGIAVELQAFGEAEEAEAVLLDSLSHVAGEDFGFGGTSAVVEAAIEMGRPELLETLYEEGSWGDRLRLSIIACRWAAGNGDGE